MKQALAVILAYALTGCATTFETDRDRVLLFGFGVTFAVVSNKTTKATTETKDAPESDSKDEGEGER